MLFRHHDVHLRLEGWMATTTGSPKPPILRLPIAHAEGNFFCTTDQLKSIEDNHQILFRYSSSNGDIDESANPNGSLANIAGICSPNGRVFALMPHPERAVDPLCGNTDGQALFVSILNQFN
jgi:phosphoribosylformylglycinamidine synthase